MPNDKLDIAGDLMKNYKRYNMSRSQASALAEQLSGLQFALANKRSTLAESLTSLIKENNLPVDKVIDRKILYKLRKFPGYRTEKMRLVRAGLVLKLDLGDMEDLLSLSGYTFSDAVDEDIVCRFLFETGMYEPFEIRTVFELSNVTVPDQIAELLEGKNTE